MAATINLADIPKLIWRWFVRLCIVALVVFVALTLARQFGFSLYNVSTYDFQATGIGVAGLAWALDRFRNL